MDSSIRGLLRIPSRIQSSCRTFRASVQKLLLNYETVPEHGTRKGNCVCVCISARRRAQLTIRPVNLLSGDKVESPFHRQPDPESFQDVDQDISNEIRPLDFFHFVLFPSVLFFHLSTSIDSSFILPTCIFFSFKQTLSSCSFSPPSIQNSSSSFDFHLLRLFQLPAYINPLVSLPPFSLYTLHSLSSLLFTTFVEFHHTLCF